VKANASWAAQNIELLKIYLEKFIKKAKDLEAIINEVIRPNLNHLIEKEGKKEEILEEK